jgi:hypothetical protein
MLLCATLKEGCEADALTALKPFLADTPQLFQAMSLPTPPSIDPKHVKEIADAITPRPNQPMREEVLKNLYSGHDTLWSQQGDPDPAFRNGTAALSRALRPFTLLASPLDLLFVRERRIATDGPIKGKYEATTYTPTALGKAVGELLKARGVI